MTTDEAMKHLFPAPVVRHAKKLAHSDEEPKPQVKGSKRSIKSKDS